MLRTPPCAKLAATSRGVCSKTTMEGEPPRLPASPPPRPAGRRHPARWSVFPGPRPVPRLACPAQGWSCDAGEGLLASLLRRMTFRRH